MTTEGVQVDAELVAELRAENSAGYEADGHTHSCLFDDVTDPDHIEPGYSCGGCGCHLMAPCDHCLHHLAPDEAHHIALMLDLTGRWTR